MSVMPSPATLSWWVFGRQSAGGSECVDQRLKFPAFGGRSGGVRGAFGSPKAPDGITIEQGLV